MQISVGCVCPPAARSCGCRPSSSHRTPPVFLSLATTTTSKDNWPHNLKLSLHHHSHSALSSWPRIGPANIVMTEMRCCDTLNSDLGISNNQEDPLATSNWDLVLGGLKLMMVNQYWSYRWQVSILALLGGTGRNATDSLTKSKEGWKTNHWSDSSLIIKISLDWGECFVLDDLLVESTVTVIWLSISKLSCG